MLHEEKRKILLEKLAPYIEKEEDPNNAPSNLDQEDNSSE